MLGSLIIDGLDEVPVPSRDEQHLPRPDDALRVRGFPYQRILDSIDVAQIHKTVSQTPQRKISHYSVVYNYSLYIIFCKCDLITCYCSFYHRGDTIWAIGRGDTSEYTCVLQLCWYVMSNSNNRRFTMSVDQTYYLREQVMVGVIVKWRYRPARTKPSIHNNFTAIAYSHRAVAVLKN